MNLGVAPLLRVHEPNWAQLIATRLQRTLRDAWDVVRWTRSPLDLIRATLPLPDRWMAVRVLNDVADGCEVGASPAALGSALAALKNLLESQSLVEGRVDYRGLPASPAYAELCQRSRSLAQVGPQSFASDAERIAFWLNAYNVLSIHGVVAMRVRQSAMELPSFFSRVAYRVGEHVFSLDDISNGVLRCAARRPATGRLQFQAGDPRLAYCPRAVDPRIHGALVCVAASCPPVGCYVAERLDAQLDMAARNLVGQCVELDRPRRLIRLPLQFYYYEADFGGPLGVARFVLRHLPEAERQSVREAFEAGWKIVWSPYDWGLNAAA